MLMPIIDADSRLRTVEVSLTVYDYDGLGLIKSLTAQGGQAESYGYDSTAGRPQTIQTGTDIFIYEYTDVNPLIQSLTRPNGSVTTYEYNDPLKRLTAIINKKSTQEIINSFAYTHNNLDVRDTETITNGESITNLTAGLTTYSNNNFNQLLSTINPEQLFTYDDDGNMTHGYTPDGYVMTMTYDAENRLKTAEYTDSNAVVHRTEYSYNGNSLLAEMKKFDNGILQSDIRYVRGGFLPVQERDANNLVTREYTWGLNYGGGIGGLLNLGHGGQNYNYLYDGKGNVSSLLDPSQAVVATYAYDSFGVLMKKTALIDQPYIFSTKENDSKTGLSYYGYRFYAPALGRWITTDPIEEEGGLNLYGFVGNNAVNKIDPLGLSGLVLFVRPWAFLRNIPRGMPEENWWKWSEYNLPPECYKTKPPIPWWQKYNWPFEWKPELPHIPHEGHDLWT